ncbi:potassium channel family protein [Clostridium tagluense]|uniref:potassium channel family protein n=1 Tax=Clostridium tagluense TaxID=360422 RepID=UPI001CF562B8|nr:potassium channel family protein [Clostridium tagluense]MCB2312093.1 potassium channel family protein [Clostridium tagluense]MCB2316722.1 potassium channel family protein [Clostridium tagluense]MCB2321538.1 potassium channel family protein [Clostridium tagluense]MCB2326591.1 potassium channel family protein [Clostridium tagluense]MCB2331314.1 potassium channel family protein [Clostridium tagluense]
MEKKKSDSWIDIYNIANKGKKNKFPWNIKMGMSKMIKINLMKNRNFVAIYEVLMALSALVVVAILIIELSCNLPQNITITFSIIDNIVVGIFTIDYFTRLFLAKDKVKFFKGNIIDLISIIPFNSVFQSIRILRLSKLLKFTKVFRSGALILKFRKYMDKFLKTNNFNYIIWITLSTLIIGAIGIHFAEGITFENALWWSFVTITTVGYGDISPQTPIGRIIAGIIMLTGIGFLGMLTATIATFFLKRNGSTSYRNQAIEDIKARLDNFDELNIEDINNIHNVLIALKK